MESGEVSLCEPDRTDCDEGIEASGVPVSADGALRDRAFPKLNGSA
jgi:hypothetical protein